MRGKEYYSDDEPFYIFRDRSHVKPEQVRNVLRKMLSELNLNPKLYDTHSFRIGRATDLKKFNVQFEQIKSLGRWRSNAIYSYLR